MEAMLNSCGTLSTGASTGMFGLLVQTLMAAHCALSPTDMWPKDKAPEAIANGLQPYDFIVVGAGSAGSVVANRLSENPNWRVLLVEAGGDPPIEAEIPAFYNYIQHTAADWEYNTEISDIASKSLKKGCYWPRGKMLGGSGSINAMIYVRGNSRDYDTWEEMGNPTWGWENVLKYFKKSEDNGFDDLVKKENGKYHAKGGYLKVDSYKSDDSFKDIMINAAKELNYKILDDVNADEYMGYHTVAGTIQNGRRSSPAKAFLSPIKDRKNLDVIKNGHVTDIIINKAGVTEGINIMIGDKKVKAVAKKEVIVSGGSINTPQLLMLSGIGPKEHLKKFNIPVKKDLAVGKNLQDHIVIHLPFKFHKSTAKRIDENELSQEIFNYIMYNTGKFSHTGATDLIGFVNTVNKTDQFPDIQYHHAQIRRGEEEKLRGFLDNAGYIDVVADSFMETIVDAELLVIVITLLNPKSFGTVELKSKNPFDKPLIYANNLAAQEDVDTMVRSIETLMPFFETKTFKEHEAELHQVNIPGCNNIKFNTKAYWECYVRHLTITCYHAVGTAKMGPDSDPEAVVDSRLKVKGIEGLRVIDGSIMPLVVSGNTNAPIIMIGEKGSDFIKEDWIKKGEKVEL